MKNGTRIRITGDNVPGLETGNEYEVVDHGEHGKGLSYVVVLAPDGSRWAAFNDEFEVIA